MYSETDLITEDDFLIKICFQLFGSLLSEYMWSVVVYVASVMLFIFGNLKEISLEKDYREQIA